MAAPVKREKAWQEDAEKVRMEGGPHLLSDLGNTLNKPETSDVAFVCNDGKKIYACRWFLSLRNPVFKGMFGNRMLESKMEEVPLPDFSSVVLLSIFEYLYTGAVHSYPPLSWEMGFEVIRASHFFMIPAMATIAQEFLWKEILEGAHLSRDLILKMLNKALEFKEEWEGRDSLLVKLTQPLCGQWFQEEDYSKDLSENVVDWLLSKRECNGSRKETRPSVEEYLTFRQVLLWQVHQELPTSHKEAAEELQRALPIEESGPELWSTIFKFPLNVDEFISVPVNASDSHDPTVVLNSRLGIGIRKESFQKLLNHIDWFQIPAMLLLKVIYPLSVIPPHALFKALAFQALRTTVSSFGAYYPYKWKCYGSLIGDAEGRLTCKSEDGSRSAWGRALPILPMPRSYGIYEWKFKISQNDADHIVLGIIYGSDNHPWEEHGLKGKTFTSCPATRLLAIRCGRGRTYVCDKEMKPYYLEEWENFSEEPTKGSSVAFTLDASEKTCRVSFGNSFATTWRNLPDAVFHPVIAIAKARSIIMNIESVQGFSAV